MSFALTQDQAFEGCAADICRLNAARRAVSYATSAVREQRVNTARRNVLASLSYRPNQGEPVLERLKRLRSIQATVSELGDREEDNELTAQARAANETVRTEREHVPLLGADAAVLGELLGVATDLGAGILKFEGGTVWLYANMRNGKCVGTYIVGSSREQRNLNDTVRSGITARLLSQSLGSEVPIPVQTGGSSMRKSMSASSRIGNVLMVARWNGTALIELRIGEARP